ncbi:MAG: MraY family glycosyltransferase, partial [Bacteroidales bacterium]
GIPAVNRLARARNLFDQPGERSSHSHPVPRLGGAMIFAGVILGSILFTDLVTASELKYIIAGMLVLFFIGIKDDLVTLTPFKKAIGQFIAALIIVVCANIRITDCYGIFNIEKLAYVPSIIISIILIMGLINSINFIDGIDGLASGIGIMASMVFGIFFIENEHISYAVICFSLAGSLAAFFYFNVLSKKNKIFMGDTGSMIIGYLLAVFTIYLIEMPSPENPVEKALPIAPAMSLAILFIPIFDGLRVSLIRFIHGKSIFRPDKNHIHHKILNITGNHLKATIIIIISNTAIILMIYMLREAGNKILTLFLILAGLIFSILLGIKSGTFSNNNNS